MASPTSDRRQGLVGNTPIKAPVTAAATAQITLSGEQTVDGVAVKAVNALGVPDRVLVPYQTDTTQNGIYDVSTAAWTRSADADGNYDLAQGTLVLVANGSANANAIFALTSPSPTIGTTPIVWRAPSTAMNLASAIGPTLIGFKQNYATAVTQLLQTKLSDIVSISDWKNRFRQQLSASSAHFRGRSR